MSYNLDVSVSVRGLYRKNWRNWRNFRSEVESKTKRAFTKSQRSITQAQPNRFAFTDHAMQKKPCYQLVHASVTEPDRSNQKYEQCHR